MHTKLKSCPFCGGTADFLRLGDRHQSCIVACEDCGGRLESGDVGERCGESWNTRPDPLTSAIEQMQQVPSAELIGCYNAADNDLDWIESIRARLIEAAKG